MADKLMRAVVTIPRVTGLPEDAITNTWHFDGDDGLVDAIYHAHVMTKLTGFYQAIDEILSVLLVAEAQVQIYDMRDASPRVPEYIDEIPLTLGSGTALPSEVAITMSFEAAIVSGANRARRRGRVYLGPLDADAVGNSTGDVRPTGTTMLLLQAAGEAMLAPVGEDPGPKVSWAVYSPTTDLTSSIDDAFHDVQSGWIDNALDTQRRRGAAATSRQIFPN